MLNEKINALLNKKIILDFGSPKVRKGFLIGIILLIFLIGALIYFTTSNAETKEPAIQSQSAATSDSAIEGKAQSKKSIYIDVSGAVKEPSVIVLAEGSRVFEAIEAAGGVTKDADLTNINRAQVVEDGSYLYIPTEKEAKQNNTDIAGGSASGSYSANNGTYSSPSADSQGKININTADSTKLQELNGVGPATAEKIIDYRNSNGNFKNIEELKNVSGIGDKTFEKMRADITV